MATLEEKKAVNKTIKEMNTRKPRKKNAGDIARAKLQENQKELTEYVIDNLNKGLSWSKCWAGIELGIPTSVTTGNHYKGANIAFLVMRTMKGGYTSNEWGTYKAWQSKGYSVQKGQKGTAIVFYKPIFEEKDGKQVFKAAILKYSTVFNRCQTDAPAVEAPAAAATCEEGLLYDYIRNAGISLVNRNRACYSPTKDQITLPKNYTDKARGWSTVAHEIIHSTGHKSRLDRDGVARFKKWGDHQYSYEELIAELGALFICGHLNLSTEDSKEQSAAYIDGWAQNLQSNPDWIWKAAKEASKACEYVLKVAKGKEKEEAA